MSSSSSSSTIDVDELLQIGTRCRELRKEKEMLNGSQSHSFELIRVDKDFGLPNDPKRVGVGMIQVVDHWVDWEPQQDWRLELHVKSLLEARAEDRKLIQKLERELLNCSQQIDYLQDQLNARNAEVYSLGEHVHDLELKLADMDNLQVKVGQLQGQIERSDTECFLLTQELKSKELELQKSVLCIEKLEESISSLTLDSQCEIESMKLDMMALEQACFEARRDQKETTLEKATMDKLIKEQEIRVYDAEEIIDCLERENKELREKFVTSEMHARQFLQKIEEWQENEDKSQLNIQHQLSESESKNMLREKSACGELLGQLFSKLAIVLAPESSLKKKMERMSHQISEYEVLVKQLKEDLREEKLKAKEEADDLAQEMAELRYQMTSLLEAECKRRACIEHASLQRIAELEAQIRKEQKPFCGITKFHEA